MFLKTIIDIGYISLWPALGSRLMYHQVDQELSDQGFKFVTEASVGPSYRISSLARCAHISLYSSCQWNKQDLNMDLLDWTAWIPSGSATADTPAYLSFHTSKWCNFGNRKWMSLYQNKCCLRAMKWDRLELYPFPLNEFERQKYPLYTSYKQNQNIQIPYFTPKL